jgi:uncharacterized repeat protein (TIGR03803 family)
MTSTRRHQSCLSKIHRCAASAALPLAFVLVLAVAATPLAQAQTYSETVLYSFAGPPDGWYPNFYESMAMSSKGFYGTTVAGGTSTNCSGGCGTVFEVSSKGKETVLYSFQGTPDGWSPDAAVVRDAKGNLYGTTEYGGKSNNCGLGGCGTVFEVSSKGEYTLLYSFQQSDGQNPYGAVVRDAKGTLYGTTISGGTAGFGTVFELSPNGIVTVLHSFTGSPDGVAPLGGLIRDAKGNLYGTTEHGGTSTNCGEGCGTVFEVSSKGTETVLYSFQGTPDGQYPVTALLRDAKGNLYGGAVLGGADGNGTVFKVSRKGVETTLYSFTGGSDGSQPTSALLRDAKGNLYGATGHGGDSNCESPYGCGVAFELSSKGTETVLHTFTGPPDAAFPLGLVQDAKGNLYGVSGQGGTSTQCGNYPGGCGTVFKLTKK